MKVKNTFGVEEIFWDDWTSSEFKSRFNVEFVRYIPTKYKKVLEC